MGDEQDLSVYGKDQLEIYAQDGENGAGVGPNNQFWLQRLTNVQTYEHALADDVVKTGKNENFSKYSWRKQRKQRCQSRKRRAEHIFL